MSRTIRMLFVAITMCMATQICAAKKVTNNHQVWDKVVANSNKYQRVKVKKVVIDSNNTQITLYVDYQKGQWIRISPETVLKAAGNKYTLKSSTVLTIGEKYTIPEDTLSFTLTFEPLPQNTKVFDFVEPKGWEFFNIHEEGYVPEHIEDTYWRNDATGDWLVGFAKDYVIYDCKVRKIASRTERKDSYTITTDDGILFNIGKIKYGVRSIKIDNAKPVNCSYIDGSTLSDYPTKDLRKGFKDNGYSLTDSVTITGWLKDMPEEIRKHAENIKMVATDVISTNQETYKAKLDSIGRFSITIPLLNTSTVYLSYGNRYFELMILEPGERYFYLLDVYTGKRLLMGSDVRMQNELLTHQPSTASVRADYREDNLDAMKFWQQADSVRNVQKDHLQSVLAKHPNLSQRYADYMEGYYLLRQGECMMQARFHVPEWKLPQEYVEYVGNEIWQKMPKPYTLHGDFGTFSRDYIDYLREYNAKRIKAGNNTDAAKAEDTDKAVIDTVCHDSELRDIVWGHRLFFELDWKRKPLPQDMENIARNDISLPAIKDYVLNLNNKYDEIDKLDISSSPCLKSADAVQGMTDGEEIFRKLMEPYKGKMVLIDVWGTWCSPCKRALAHSQEEYARLKPYDVVYMYLAMSSEDTSWKNVIKQYNVLGDNVVHYNLPHEQEMALEKYIKVRGYPTYKLVDKQGNLLEDGVDARNLDALEKLLKKL